MLLRFKYPRFSLIALLSDFLGILCRILIARACMTIRAYIEYKAGIGYSVFEPSNFKIPLHIFRGIITCLTPFRRADVKRDLVFEVFYGVFDFVHATPAVFLLFSKYCCIVALPLTKSVLGATLEINNLL